MENGGPIVQRWTGDPPAQEALLDLYRAEQLQPYAWSNGPNDTYAPHEHNYEKVLRVVRGSIRFYLPERGESIDLSAGDTLVLSARIVHSAIVGPEGVTCLEARR
jgi:quercetin dioxygenase-like cupin family protein